MKLPVPVCEAQHINDDCKPSEAEIMTAKALGMTPEDMHNLMDWHMHSLHLVAQARSAAYRIRKANEGTL
jgi:hypothetical protein